MKRVLLFTENLGSGGAERQLTGLAVLLKDKGYIVKVLTYVEKQFFEPYLRDNDIDYELISSIYSKKNGFCHLYKALKIFKPDVIISYLPSPNIRMCLIHMFYKARLIISERSHTEQWNLSTRFKYFLYRKAEKIVANSYSETENIINNCPKLHEKTITIPNYVDTKKYYPSYDKKDKDIIHILSVGRLIPSKNALKFIEAIALLKGKHYNIFVKWVGKQYSEHADYCNAVKSKITLLKLEDSFILSNESKNVVLEYHSADIFCMPTLYEGFPNVICEAMSCGLPIVCSNVCENPRIVTEGINGFLFDPTDVSEIASSIEKLILLPEKQKEEMRIENRKKMERDNSMEAFVNKYITIIE